MDRCGSKVVEARASFVQTRKHQQDQVQFGRRHASGEQHIGPGEQMKCMSKGFLS